MSVEHSGVEAKQDSRKRLFRQFLAFGVVGASSAVIQLGVYYGLLALGLSPNLSYAAGYVLSLVNTFCWNRGWVFREKGDTGGQVIRFVSVYGASFLVSNGLMYALVQWAGLSDKTAPLLVLAVVTICNFFANKYWTFKEQGA